MITNLINIIQIATVAINSMASRFISISIHQNDYDKANKYFSSVFWANIIMSIVLIIPTIVIVIFVDKVFEVPVHLIRDVQVSFTVLMVNFVVSICFSVFAVGTFVTNRLDLSYIRSMIAQCLRGATIVALFAFCKPTIIYVVISTMAATCFTAITNVNLTKRLVPNLKMSITNFDKYSIRELFGAGVWNSIGTLSYDLFSGIDLIIANLFVSASAMGVLSVSKTLPNTVNTLVTTVVAIFMPSYVEFYAKKQIEKIRDGFETSNKIMLAFIVPILSFIVGFGDKFYQVWMPTLNSKELQILTILSVMPLYLAIGSKGLANIFTVTNRIKVPTIATFLLALMSTGSVFLLLRFTDLGIYAIVGVSAFYLCIKELVFVPLYAAMCLEVKLYSFFKSIIQSLFVVAVSLVISYLFGTNAIVTGWISLIKWAVISSGVVFAVIVIMLFRKKDYITVINKIWKKKVS